ncbi:FkbM family methyltransferase [Vulcanisaeta sp. JCM 14467]|uniref:FkbM family methyltransferase n=1 Tax=Vulcanisaeta sp. JCM 14467 TaxID=1295370 RepID=UPI00210F8D4E|nr:FkbM family methyltransferase [Vulcanisaeta sp. JCM 14467]
MEVPMVTLKQLINNYNIEPGILKMDYEGCEFDIILNDYESVRLFRELIFELHEYRGPSKELMNRLINDYRCREVRIGKDLEIVHCVRLW